jgi:hypothetical protein
MVPSNHIAKVGFEVEGGWDGKSKVSPFSDVSLIHEGSINGQTLAGAPKIRAIHIGEVVSLPMSYANDPWALWLYEHWPNAAPRNRTNRTCGFHIHLSTLNLKDYTLLSSKHFLYSLRDKLKEIGTAAKLNPSHVFWERMEGFNSFCPLDFDPAEQMRVTRKGGRNRYGWLNFAWSMHTTVEFRALPTFRDPQIALRFTAEYFDFVNSWLDANQNTQLVRAARLVG